MNLMGRLVFPGGIVRESAEWLFFATTNLIQTELFDYQVHRPPHALAQAFRIFPQAIADFDPANSFFAEGNQFALFRREHSFRFTNQLPHMLTHSLGDDSEPALLPASRSLMIT